MRTSFTMFGYYSNFNTKFSFCVYQPELFYTILIYNLLAYQKNICYNTFIDFEGKSNNGKLRESMFGVK